MHQLSEAGDRILTTDDPQVARANGDGMITDHFENRETGERRLAFRTASQGNRTVSVCAWTLKTNELTIIRNDSNAGENPIISELNVRRTQGSPYTL
jgi:hypothetical protein